MLPANQVEEALFLGMEMENDTSKKTVQKRGGAIKSNAAWFGPRLGRKKRSLTLDDEVLDIIDNKINRKPNSASEDLVLQYLKNYPWVLVPVIGEGIFRVKNEANFKTP